MAESTGTLLTAPQVEPLCIGPLVIDPPVLQAPMAGFTNYAFRQMVRDYGGAPPPLPLLAAADVPPLPAAPAGAGAVPALQPLRLSRARVEKRVVSNVRVDMKTPRAMICGRVESIGGPSSAHVADVAENGRGFD